MERTASASLGPTPEMARNWSKRARSLLDEKPKSSMASSRTMSLVRMVTPASPACGSAAAVVDETPSS